MAEPAMRVALLARPGAACDNLQAALRQAGADIVLVADPTSSDAGSVSASSPQAVLVALEPGVEESLARYDGILLDPGTIVIYDEVALAARREGWDAARWARHLAAKLGRHHDVLPPGADVDIQQPPIPRKPAAPLAPTLEAAPAPTLEPMPAPTFEAAPAPTPDTEPAGLSLADDFDQSHLGVDAAEPDRLDDAAAGIDFGGFTDEMKAALAMDADEVADAAPAPAPTLAIAEEEPAHVLEWEPQAAPPAPAQAAPETSAPAPAPVRFSLDDMALVESDAPRAPQPVAAPVIESSLELSASSEQGAVVVLAGIGGPDAVRQFLGALPAGFPHPIIVRQRLDGGRHDRLVKQMQRATSLPVELAEAGASVSDGRVYILPDGMATTQATGALTFCSTGDAVPVLAGLPPGDSAILMLSGSDPAAVPEVMAAAAAGALVAAQAPEECFDSAAPLALIAAGGASNPPRELARRLTTRWLSLKD